MKKVLFTATVDSHILQFHIPFLKYFKDKGYEVHVATNGDEEIPYCDKKIKVSFERSPFKFNNIRAIKQLRKVINEEHYDIIHTHTPMGSVVTRLASKSARKSGTRVIYTAHGFHFYKGASLKNWLLFYPIEKLLSRITDDLITINMEDYELARKKFNCQVHYVPGVGIDENKFDFSMSNEDKKELRKSLNLKDEDFVMIYPAEISARKRQMWLINAIAELLRSHKDIHLLLPGKDSLNGKCQKLVKELELSSQVHFLGYRKDIPKLLKIANVALSSANQEGLPVNIMEAMYIGLPIVASDCRGNRDLVKNKYNGYLIEIKDSTSFSNSVEKIYQNDKETIQFSKNSKKEINNYLLNKIMTKMDDIYSKKEIALIIPTCTDLNRGDQALVLETKKVIDKIEKNNICYMMSTGETIQCENYGLRKFSDILKHPSRFDKKSSNVKYGIFLKIRWGIIALFDYITSSLLLHNFTRNIISVFLPSETKKSINLYKNAKYIFVKGGGFLHDYSGGLIGRYTMYYQTFHIRLAIKMKKKVYIMPNSFGPFKSKSNIRLINKIMNQCQFVSARESISASNKTNTLNREIDLYPDLAFFLHNEEKNEKVNNLLLNLGINEKKDDIIAITVRPYRFYSYENPEQKYYDYKLGFVKFISYLQNKKYKILLVVHTRAENDHENDERCIDEILEMIDDKKNVFKIKDDTLNCYNLKYLYGKCKYVVGTRFHSVIFSIEQLIPCIAVTYGGNKGDGIMKDMNLEEYAIKIGELSYEKLVEKFEQLDTNCSEVRGKIKKYISHANNKYEEMIEKIKEI